MTINEIITEALNDPQNWVDGEVDWNYVDSDLWLHPDSKKYSDFDKVRGLDSFPDELIPSLENGGLKIVPFTQKNGLTVSRRVLTNPRVTHPVP
jgi:hypothetical protein